MYSNPSTPTRKRSRGALTSPKSPGNRGSARRRRAPSTLGTPSRYGASPSRSPNKSWTQRSPNSSRHSTPTKDLGDRFIPSRKTIQENTHLFAFPQTTSSPGRLFAPSTGMGDVKQDFKLQLAQDLLDMDASDCIQPKILARNHKPSPLKPRFDSNLREQFTYNSQTQRQKPPRQISSSPERILDAPELLDDYYLNLLDWSCDNLLAVGLGTSLYLWNASSGEIDLLVENKNNNHITSIRWANDGVHLAVGTNDKEVMIWNVEKKTKLRAMKGHLARVGALAWSGNGQLASGSRDSMIFLHDIRAPAHHTATLLAHEEEICGLKWSPDGSQLASGGNDNLCCVWDRATMNNQGCTPRFTFSEHKAAVKALSWCPWQKNVLATGGGTADRCIRFFNTSTGTCLNTIDTRSQVCSILWSQTEKELLSAHGFSLNQLTVWKYPTMTQIACLTGHTSRVLHTALSPDGTTVCSAAADETLRFWKVWPEKKHNKKKMHGKQEQSLLDTSIR